MPPARDALPVVYLDVDGALSALSGVHGFGDGPPLDRYGDVLTVSDRLGTRLRALDAELRWLTTWGADGGLTPADLDAVDAFLGSLASN